jgi:hypothetical protein
MPQGHHVQPLDVPVRQEKLDVVGLVLEVFEQPLDLPVRQEQLDVVELVLQVVYVQPSH